MQVPQKLFVQDIQQKKSLSRIFDLIFLKRILLNLGGPELIHVDRDLEYGKQSEKMTKTIENTINQFL